MRIEELWDRLDEDASRAPAGAWVTRSATEDQLTSLLLAVQQGSGQRAMMLQCAKAEMPPRREWPSCHGIEIAGAFISGAHHLVVLLKDKAAQDVFTSLIVDALPRLVGVTSSGEAGRRLLDRLGRWKKFLAAGATGLSATEQRGLYAELRTLRDVFLGHISPLKAVKAWTGPQRSHQDFRLEGVGVEVKATVESVPVEVKISSARQLDDSGFDDLFLRVVLLDDRVLGEVTLGFGESLQELVEDIRQRLDATPEAVELFNDSLLDAKYLETDGEAYQLHRYAVRDTLSYRVTDGFPRILERNLPIGVGDVAYIVAVAACTPFCISEDDMASRIEAMAQPDMPRRQEVAP